MWSSICSGEHASEYLLSLEMIKIMDGTQITDRQTSSQPGIHNPVKMKMKKRFQFNRWQKCFHFAISYVCKKLHNERTHTRRLP